MICSQKNSRLTYGVSLSRQLDAAMLQFLHPLLQVSLFLHERSKTMLKLLHGSLQGLMDLHWHSSFWGKQQKKGLFLSTKSKKKTITKKKQNTSYFISHHQKKIGQFSHQNARDRAHSERAGRGCDRAGCYGFGAAAAQV